MEALHAFLAVALAEVRSARRLARTWLFAVLVVLAGLIAFFYYTFLHTIGSGAVSVVGVVNPRFILAGLGAFAIWALVVVAVFLAFDVRARDVRERVADSLDTRPIGNLTLLGGRLAGLVLVAWMPIVTMLLLVQGLGALLAWLVEGFGEPIDWRSVAIVLFVDAPPALAFWCSLVILLAVTARNRLLVAVIALALVGVQMWYVFRMPSYLQVFSGLAAALQASDVQPRFVEGVEWLHRGCQYLLAGGFLCFAAALHPRPDQGSRAVRLASGGVMAVLAGAGVAALVSMANDDVAQRARWAEAHRSPAGAVPDLQRVTGLVAIDPEDVLRLDLQYSATVPDDAETLAFTLNPALRISSLLLDGAAATFRHEQGLLTVPLPAGAGPDVTLEIAASGVPDPAFAYLDASIDLSRLTGSSPLLLMGTEATMFESGYVALMPGAFWMPTPGVAVGRHGPHVGRDFFVVDLEVQTPAEWLVAGPGRREGEAGRFRFRPSAPLPEVGLLAARFERFAVEVEDVELEVLISPVHIDSVRQFADAAEEIEAALQEMLSNAARWGLPYPYGGLSVVETPTQLRTFGGGWLMDTVQALPGVLMLRETGLPTAKFFHPIIRDLDEVEKNSEEYEGGVARFKANTLRQFFQNDVAGGNPLHGAVRNVLGFQTSASGQGAAALNFLLHDLAVQLIVGSRSGFFSPYLLRTQSVFQQSVVETVTAMASGRAASFGGSVYMGSTRRPSVWDRALGASLKDLDPSEDPEVALNVLWLKGPEIAQAMMDGLGRESVAALLAELRRRHAGGTFTEQGFNAAAAAVGFDFETLLGDWLDSAALPGFVFSPATIDRLRDDDQGRPRYQISLHVYNDEPVPGLVRLGYGEWQGEEIGWVSDATPPTRVAAKSAVELGLVATNLPEQLNLRPYLALNRSSAINLPLPEVDEAQAVDAEPFSGARPSAWQPERQPGILVDDLDEGFSVRFDDFDSGPRLGGNQPQLPPDTEIDQGLPVFSPQQFPGWARQEQDGAIGKYRRTLSRSWSGDGRAKAIFSAELPSRGRWRLEYHLPPIRSFSFSISVGANNETRSGARVNAPEGAYDMRILAAGDETKIDFDAGAGQLGWNRLGDFDMPAGEVQVQVSDETSAGFVVADAIRWTQVDDR